MTSVISSENTGRRPFREPSYIVGVGASAGGLEALEQLFRNIPDDSGAAFVVVQHLSPDFKSLMNELLARHTKMTIQKVEDGIRIEADNIYLMPPKVEMIVSGGRLLLTEKDPETGLALPIDTFFRSLAQDAGAKSIGIVLSGTGSDGSRGIRDIHTAGGLVLVQSLDSAKFDGMPRSARDTGVCDLLLPPEGIAGAMLEHIGCPVDSSEAPVERLPETAMESICRLLQDEFGVDFSHYKPTTLTRRIDRRMLLQRIGSLEDFVRLLETSPEELARMHADLLIGVTHFFRDTGAWDLVEDQVVTKILQDSEEQDEIRAWVAGCATGEEAYTLAILFLEGQQRLGIRRNVKIFATDVHKLSLEKAAAGVYPKSSLADCSVDRLDRYFSPIGDSYQISPELRKLIVFAAHDVINDAPFTRLHMISCRNLLIYLRPEVQQRVLSLFHFGLRTNGVLFLGLSETIGELDAEVDTIDEHWKLYRKRREVRLPEHVRLSPPRLKPRQRIEGGRGISVPTFRGDLLATYDALLNDFMPCSLLVNQRRELVQSFGSGSRLLKLPEGRFSGDVTDLVDPALRPTLIGMLQRTQKTDEVLRMESVRIPVNDGEEYFTVTIRPQPQRPDSDRTWLVVFEPKTGPSESESVATSVEPADLDRTNLLETELRYTKENLQATIEELEASNEELQATNEELVASNEELQSTNEELNSVNEELYTVNAEHQKKIDELTDVTNDLENLFRGTDIGTIFLDRDLTIRRFTPAAAAYADLVAHDIGRSLETFAHRFHHESLLDNLREVLALGAPIEVETTDKDGRSFLLRMLPYMVGSKIAGALLTMIDVTRQLRLQSDRDQTTAQLDELYRSAPVGLAMIDRDLKLQRINGTLCDWIGETADSITGRPIRDVDEVVAGELEPHVRRILESGAPPGPIELSVKRPSGQLSVWVFRLYPVRISDEIESVGIVVTDITLRKRAESELRDRTAELAQLYRTVPVGLATLDRDLKYVRINQHLADINGHPIEDHIGRRLRDAVPELADQVEPLMHQVLDTGEPTELREVTGRTPAAPNDERTWLIVYHPVTSGSEVLGVGVVVTEITELKVFERDLKQKTKELERSNKELEEFAYAASHDLQEPLRTIATYCTAIDEDYREILDDEGVQFLDFVVDATRRMREQIQGLLEYSRIARGPGKFVEVDCNQIIDDVREDLHTAIRETAAEVNSDTLPVVRGDGRLLLGLFRNLISNAVKFARKGNPPIVRISSSETDSHWQFSVADNGIGIDPAQADRIFQVFQRLHSSAEYAGTGIGLALCKKIVELHGGTIELRPSEASGSTFVFSISKSPSQ